jgi:hypothetical protein
MVSGGMQAVRFPAGLQEKPITPGTLRGERAVNDFPVATYGHYIVMPAVSIGFKVDILTERSPHITQ